MLRFLFDTDHLTLYSHRHRSLLQRMVLQPPQAVGVSAVTAEESMGAVWLPYRRPAMASCVFFRISTCWNRSIF